MTAELEEELSLLPTEVLADILKVIIIRLGQRGLINIDEFRLLIGIEDWQDLRTRKVA